MDKKIWWCSVVKGSSHQSTKFVLGGCLPASLGLRQEQRQGLQNGF